MPFTGAIEILATIPSWWLASFFYATLMGRCDVYGIPVIVTLLIPLIWIVRIRVPTHADPLLGFAVLGTCLLLFIQLINPMPEAIGAGWWAIACSCLPWLAMAMYGAHQSESIIRGLGWSLALLVCVSLMGQALTSGITYRQASWWGVGNINVFYAITLPGVGAWLIWCLGTARPREAIIAMMVVAALIAVAYMTGRRLAFAVMVCGAFGCFIARNEELGIRRIAMVGAVIVLLVAPLFVAVGMLPTTGDEARDRLLQAAWGDCMTSPWLGIGTAGAIHLGISERSRELLATGIWTHHCHSFLLESLLRGGVAYGFIQAGLWVGAAWRWAVDEDQSRRMAVGGLLLMQLGFATIDPGLAEPLGMLLIGVTWWLTGAGRPVTPALRKGSHGLHILCCFCGLGFLIWSVNRLMLSALIPNDATPATLARAAEKSIDPIVSAHLIQLLEVGLHKQDNLPVFLLASRNRIRAETGSAGPYWKVVRYAAALAQDHLAYVESSTSLIERNPFQVNSYLQLGNRFHGPPPYQIPEPIRQRISWLNDVPYPNEIIPDPISVESAANAIVAIASRNYKVDTDEGERTIRLLLDRFGHIPVVSRFVIYCVAMNQTIPIEHFLLPPQGVGWGLRLNSSPNFSIELLDKVHQDRGNQLTAAWTDK